MGPVFCVFRRANCILRPEPSFICGVAVCQDAVLLIVGFESYTKSTVEYQNGPVILLARLGVRFVSFAWVKGPMPILLIPMTILGYKAGDAWGGGFAWIIGSFGRSSLWFYAAANGKVTAREAAGPMIILSRNGIYS